jgi:hypothetical protein
MDIRGYGGRGAIHYTCSPEDALKGVLLTDPPREPEDGWNKPRIIKTPFGDRIFSGAMILRCGNCGKMQFPKRPNIRMCKCDYREK